MKRPFCSRLLLLFAAIVTASASADEFPTPYDSQLARGEPTTPAEALAGMQLPPGFKASLFAAEPDVRQPIAMTFDARGRLWVAENFTYAEYNLRFDTKLRDRILIFEDINHDGRFDKRTVFWDGGVRLSSIEVGFGGVWVTCAPYLMFLPDGDGDDKPDSAPVVLLDGWNEHGIHHCLVNGLRWGPDGWLYGRQGILDTSHVGRPGTPQNNRIAVNGGVWRYHPTRHTFEVVSQGTTNPWGLDWDEHGQGFFINTVIGHLWHLIPGAHYQRMFGQDPDTENLYELIPQTADHYHWDTREHWEAAVDFGLSDDTHRAGGGHAHAGLMIYQGDNWPADYRGDVFALNFHGRRVNRDHPQRHGASYTASHRPDPILWSDEWFRGIDLISGPDGGVFIADWSDTGECHEADGVHRSTGRIYKVVHGTPQPPAIADVGALSDIQLVELQRHANVWFARQARRILQERAVAGQDLTAATTDLRTIFASSEDVPLRLKSLWCLKSIGAIDEAWLLDHLDDPSEYVRSWIVQLLVDAGPPSDSAAIRLAQRAAEEDSGLVLINLASALRQLPADRCWEVAAAIARHDRFADDPVLPLMIWYGIEPTVVADANRAAAVAADTPIESLRRFISRRLAQERDRPELLQPIFRLLVDSQDLELRHDLLAGMMDVFGSLRRVDPPTGWEEAASVLKRSDDRPSRLLVRELSAIFGDASALEELQTLAADSSADLPIRLSAIRTLSRLRAPGLNALLGQLLKEPALATEAVRGLATFDDEETSQLILELYSTLTDDAREAALAALASRQSSAKLLLEAITAGQVDKREVSASVVSQLRFWGDDPLPAIVEALWGQKRPVSGEARERIEQLRETLSDGRLDRADASRGRAVFEKTCTQCHRLFGEGGAIGPELTGAQRGDLGYLLENIIAPSATLAADYRVTIFALADGRVISGVVAERAGGSVAIQTPSERIVVPAEEIEAERQADYSLMPDGLIDNLDDKQFADLIRYLQSPRQVASTPAAPNEAP